MSRPRHLFYLSLSSTGLLNRIILSFKPNLIGLQSFTYALLNEEEACFKIICAFRRHTSPSHSKMDYSNYEGMALYNTMKSGLHDPILFQDPWVGEMFGVLTWATSTQTRRNPDFGLYITSDVIIVPKLEFPKLNELC